MSLGLSLLQHHTKSKPRASRVRAAAIPPRILAEAERVFDDRSFLEKVRREQQRYAEMVASLKKPIEPMVTYMPQQKVHNPVVHSSVLDLALYHELFGETEQPVEEVQVEEDGLAEEFKRAMKELERSKRLPRISKTARMSRRRKPQK